MSGNTPQRSVRQAAWRRRFIYAGALIGTFILTGGLAIFADRFFGTGGAFGVMVFAMPVFIVLMAQSASNCPRCGWCLQLRMTKFGPMNAGYLPARCPNCDLDLTKPFNANRLKD